MPKANAENTTHKTKHAKAAGAAKPDPIYAAIDRDAAAYKAWDEALTARGRLEGLREKHKPGFAAADRKADRLGDVFHAARKALLTTRPKTIEGSAAAAQYLRARYINDNGGRDRLFDELPILDAFTRMTTALAPRVHSPGFLKVRAIVKRLDTETAKRHVRWLKWRKKEAVKDREKRRKRGCKFKKSIRKLSAAEARGQRQAFGQMSRIIKLIEPAQPKTKTKRQSVRKAA